MAIDTTPDQEEDRRAPEPGDDYQPPRMKYLLAALVTCVAAAGLIALFGGGSNEPRKPAAAAGLAYMDGTLTVVEQDRLVMKPYDGSGEVTFAIRPADAGNFDLAHLQSHSSVAIPTRIFYRDEGGTRYAVYKEDAPVNSRQPQP